jgi:drug/metabolite transporter (DMT)-like permease
MLWLGMAAVLASSAAYNAGVVLQALDAREQPDDCGLKVTLLLRLLRRRRWLIGTFLSIGAFPLQVLAYAHAPLTAVQPGLAAGLVLVLILGARYMEEPIRKRDYAAVIAIVGGLALIAGAGPARSLPSRGGAVPLVVMALLGLGVLAPYALRSRTRSMATVLIASSGLAFAWNDLATKLFSDGLAASTLAIAGGWLLAVAASAAIATLSEMTAFQHASVRRVVPAVYVLETIIPIAFAPLMLRGDAGIHAGDAAPIGAGLVLVVAGVVALASNATVMSLMSPVQAGRKAAEKLSEARATRSRRTPPGEAPPRGPTSQRPDATVSAASLPPVAPRPRRALRRRSGRRPPPGPEL